MGCDTVYICDRYYTVSHSKGSYLQSHRHENIQSRLNIRCSEFHLLVLRRTDALQMSCFMGQEANFLQYKRSTDISKNVTCLWYDRLSTHHWHRMKYTVMGTASCIFLPTDMWYISLCLGLLSYLILTVYRHAYWRICILTTYRHSYWHLWYNTSPYILVYVYIDIISPCLLTRVILTVYRVLTDICVTYRHAYWHMWYWQYISMLTGICLHWQHIAKLTDMCILTTYRHVYCRDTDNIGCTV
jgi:hypothetical protein